MPHSLRTQRLVTRLAAVAAMLLPATLPAQEPLLDQLEHTFKTEALSLGALLQIVGDWQSERTEGRNGFSVANMRLNVGGRLDGGFGYFLQMNFINTTAILDARLDYRLTDAVTASAGRFKVPFSAEFLTGAGSIDFVNRAQVVTTLAPGRDVGLQLRVAPAERFDVAVGAFNGNGSGIGNDNDAVLVGGRVRYQTASPTATRRLVVGVHAAASSDAAVPIGGNVGATFAGDRLLVGGDARWILGPNLLSGEILVANLEPVAGTEVHPFGWHLTAGRMLTQKSQILLRWDAFRGDAVVLDRDLVILGYNRWPTRATELQVNLLWSTDDDHDRLQLLVNAQIGF